MSFLGKLLVVVHVIMSVMFMAFAGAVFTAQNNWRTKFDNGQKQLQTAQTAAQAAEAAAKAEIDQKQTELTRVQNDRTTWEGKAKALEAENTRLDTENKSLKVALDGQRVIAELNSQEAEERSKESQVQRARNMELNQSRDETVTEVNRLRDKIFSMDLELTELKSRQEQLLKTNATMRAFLASKDLTTDPKQMTVQGSPPPGVEGKILSARREQKGSRILVEISLGQDDGLVIGHTLTAYRGDKYLGRIRLQDVRPDHAVGVVVETAPNSTIQANDYVTTKF